MFINDFRYIETGVRELNLSIDTSRSKQSSIEDIDTVCGHNDFDVLGRLETVKLNRNYDLHFYLIEQLKHCPLNLTVTATFAFDSRSTNRVHFIDEDEARGMLTSHQEQFPDHPGTFSDVLLYQFRATNTNEGTILRV